MAARPRRPGGAVDARSPVQAARREFDRWAALYGRDPLTRLFAGPQRRAVAALGLRPGDRFLDVGCGPGAAVRIAGPTVERAVGLDLSQEMLKRARMLARDLPNVEFVEGESGHLPFGDGEFTAALCTTSLHHHPDPRQTLREMARVLAAGGRLVIGDASADRLTARVVDVFARLFERGHVRLYRTEELARFVDGAGLVDAAVRWLWHQGYVILRAGKP